MHHTRTRKLGVAVVLLERSSVPASMVLIYVEEGADIHFMIDNCLSITCFAPSEKKMINYLKRREIHMNTRLVFKPSIPSRLFICRHNVSLLNPRSIFVRSDRKSVV